MVNPREKNSPNMLCDEVWAISQWFDLPLLLLEPLLGKIKPNSIPNLKRMICPVLVTCLLVLLLCLCHNIMNLAMNSLNLLNEVLSLLMTMLLRSRTCRRRNGQLQINRRSRYNPIQASKGETPIERYIALL